MEDKVKDAYCTSKNIYDDFMLFRIKRKLLRKRGEYERMVFAILSDRRGA